MRKMENPLNEQPRTISSNVTHERRGFEFFRNRLISPPQSPWMVTTAVLRIMFSSSSFGRISNWRAHY